mgnify:CR=1 FL=1
MQISHHSKVAYDPENGTERILDFSWDSVRVESDRYPEAAEKMSETLAIREDTWYMGTGTGEQAFDTFGYDGMLGAAEDNYTVTRQFGGGSMELSASRTVEAVRADDEVCVFLVHNSDFLGGAHGSYDTEALCFDARSGDILQLEDLSATPDALKTSLLREMLRLAAEDADGYYSSRLDLLEPQNYEAAFAGLLRDGRWWLAKDGFTFCSTLYELGSYAAGVTEFVIPYAHLTDVLDARWIPSSPMGSARLSVLPLSELFEGQVEIVDLLTIGEGSAERGILFFEGHAEDVSVSSAFLSDRFYAGSQLWYCGSMQDSALQLEIAFLGDLPNTMVSWRDTEGRHEQLIGQSGKDGSLYLTEN